ncbi:AAA family ATPase [Sporosarcina ureilytica]|uniref:Nuclease SbcCD subunit C n=1 Tax=Sporosarcina ureilytica TaxID=298596 RepID=A0A1D8JEN5_9BACL|nr:SbcC/MukB-like Walker B domain-containing protein [Sporosarcina ureilytica]AOV07170.1 hypothetical protein BI350_06200 [Sporosarcina ureilytica]
MKPVTLKMTAFGPYKETEVVDFQDLQEHLLFVISGATGSGKTTIFDGICFALYGEASGEDRTDIRALRSDFAQNDTQTAVELIFEIHRRTYRIMRQVPYTKVGNKSETPARCELYELTEDGEVPVVDRQMVSEINRKIESLIGFTQAQFSQIVMLPQGEFRKFLTSDTENKELIMRKIFKTDQYREIVKRLQKQRDEAKAKLDRERQQERALVEQISASLPNRESSIFHLLASENYNAQQIIEGLNEEKLFYENKIHEDKEAYEKAYKKHGEMVDRYHAAKSINERFIELEQRQNTYQQMVEQIPFFEQEAKRLEQAERALTIEQIEYQFEELTKELVAREEVVVKSVHAVQVAKERLAKVNVQFKVEEEKQQQLEQIKVQLFRLQDALPKVKDLASKKQRLHSLENELKNHNKSFVELTEQATHESEKVTHLTEQINQREEAVISLDEKVELLTTINEKCKLVDEYIALRKQTEAYERTKNERKQFYNQAQSAYEQLTSDWLIGEAATLAAKLHEGEACPVCGSADHPQKAHETNITVSKEELEEKKQQLTNIESAYRIADADYQSSFKQLQSKAQRFEDGDVDVRLEQIDDESQKINEEKAQVEKEVMALRAIRQELVQLKERLMNQRKVADEALNLKLVMERNVYESNALIEKEQALFEQIIREIPGELRELTVLEQKINHLTKERNTIEQAWQVIQKQLEESRELVASSKSAKLHAIESRDDTKLKSEQAEKRFQEALEKSTFPTKQAYQEAKMDEDSRRVLRTKIDDFKQQFYSIRKAVKELSAFLEGKQKLDLEKVEVTLAELKTAYEVALQAVNQSRSYYNSIEQLKEQLIQVTERLSVLERKFGQVEDLYDVIRGNNHLKLSFERYIQIEYLEQMIQSANERLRDISNGQFELIRSDRQEVRGRQSGLGLDVYDAYTGQTRDVKTLSGGEKFNASLSLALGMADIIQSFQGAVSIDTMFIDEGFGTLDEESLTKAIDTLIDLQKAGRMIGVISHVEELKAAFPAILEVKKSKEGHSQTSFVIK